MSKTANNSPKPSLTFTDAIALIVGIVMGAGIFRTPSLVAANVDQEWWLIGIWLAGGVISLIGALCYAELVTAFPNTGGDYHFLLRAFGRRVAFLFAWARMSVIQTGSIALLCYIFGDYATLIYNLGPYSSEIYAAATVVFLTGINLAGIQMGTGAQKVLTIAEVFGLVAVIIVGFFFSPEVQTAPVTAGASGGGSFGLALVFVLLTFGGWNEAAYISAELKSGSKLLVKALISGIVAITLIYILINLAFLKGLGLNGMAGTDAVAGDLLGQAFGNTGMLLIAVIVAVAALTSANATIFTGARSNYALGRDFPVFSYLGKWGSGQSGPVNALIVQGLFSVLLVGLGLLSRNGFETMVDYTAPVFWFFFLMVGIALFRLRKNEPDTRRPFRVPLYPVLPLLFCLSSAYLLYSSIMYTGWGALVGIGVLLVGMIFLLVLPKEKLSSEH
jgi:basic amino acid/polyamine antiporter, APA family